MVFEKSSLDEENAVNTSKSVKNMLSPENRLDIWTLTLSFDVEMICQFEREEKSKMRMSCLTSRKTEGSQRSRYDLCKV